MSDSPLADQLRPQDFDQFVGQEHLLGESGVLKRLIDQDELVSMIFWGPPGCGKTTLARLIAQKTKSEFIHFSAVSSGIDEVKKIIARARVKKDQLFGGKTILFVDEIHRFNKLQQDAFLPAVEDGTITLIGATTENPSFEVISPLLSRCKVFVLNSLESKSLEKIIDRAAKELKIKLKPEARAFLLESANGDARSLLNTLEIAAKISPQTIETKTIESALQKTLLYDKHGEEHYNLISAIHKSMRGSDPDAAIYYACRMLEGGEDPLYLARRMVRFASEDIGNADPQALLLAVSVFQACELIGMPECRIFLVQLAAYLAQAPKDNSAYLAEGRAREDIKQFGNLPVPLHLRNAPTKLMKELGYSKGYKYAHDYSKDELRDEVYLPDKLKGRKYYKKLDRS